MKLVVAAVRPTPILWWRASELASPTEVPASTLPARGIAPVRAIIASRSVVLPLWKGPTSAIHRGPRGLLTSCPIAASSSGARPLIGSADRCSPYIGNLARRKIGAEDNAMCPGNVSRTGFSVLDDAPQSRDPQLRMLSVHTDQQRTARGPR